VYFVLALGLFPVAGYLGVWARLTAALDGLGLAVPSPQCSPAGGYQIRVCRTGTTR
jgi:hypothetical protein